MSEVDCARVRMAESLTILRCRATFVSSLERGVDRSLLWSTEKSFHCLVVARRECIYRLEVDKIIQNENQTESKHSAAQLTPDVSKTCAQARSHAAVEHVVL